MKFIILIAAFLVSLADSTTDSSSGESAEKVADVGVGCNVSCPTISSVPISMNPFSYNYWYEVQRSPAPSGPIAPRCVTYNFGSAYGAPVQQDLKIKRVMGLNGNDLSVSIVYQTPSSAMAGTFGSWVNIHSTDDTKAPSTYNIIGADPNNGLPIWIVLYWCESGVQMPPNQGASTMADGISSLTPMPLYLAVVDYCFPKFLTIQANVRVLTIMRDPSESTLLAAQAQVVWYNIPGVNLVYVNQTGC